MQDSTAGRTLLEQAAAHHPGLRKVWGDGGYRKHFIEHAAALGIDLLRLPHRLQGLVLRLVPVGLVDQVHQPGES